MKPRSMKKSHRDFDGEFHEGTHKQETARAVQVDDKEGLTGSTMPARIDIEDTGCGIAEENIGKLSTPFSTTKEEGEGIGLGPAVTHGIIRHCGGDIRVVSSGGKGTTFSVFLGSEGESKKKNAGGNAR